ncbi:unnamed protein product [Calypogeia fissa]
MVRRMGKEMAKPEGEADVSEQKKKIQQSERNDGNGYCGDDDDDMRSSWPFASCYTATTLLLAGFAVFLRILVGLHSYSGKGTPPKFGDYEAQRHWMEITIHTPVGDWYRNTTENDLGWWGLDYPPLTAYQSYVHGLVVQAFDPEAVALRSSRGYETYGSKLLMRWTVLSSDILVFFPAALCFVNVFYAHRGAKQRIWALAVILLQPALIIIDHGHFQFNCISLGLAVGAAAAVVSRHELLACVLFSLSLNHKQMSMYYAPAFFAYLLGKALQRRNPLLRVFQLGCTVILTFTICWWPFLRSSGAASEVLSRLAPLHRGLYEDYVANFWCGTTMLFKWKHLFAQPTLAKLALGATISAALPSMVQQIRAPSRKGFLYAMLNSSFAFYFFAYQVHEKSILLPIIPASLLALEEPQVLQWLVPYSMFSMLPLLRRDDLLIPYLALMWLFFLIPRPPTQSQKISGASARPEVSNLRFFLSFSVLGASVLHLMYFILQAPKRYPFLFEAFIMSYSFAHFVPLALYTNWKQWTISVDVATKQKVS